MILQTARVVVLLALLVPVRPAGFRFAHAINSADWPAAVWPWLALVAIPLAFVAVASAGRRRRHSPWLLAGEGLLAALIGLLLPLWSLWSPFGQFTFPVVLHPLAAALRHPFAFDPGIVRGLYWLILVLAFTWLVLVAATALRQRRRGDAQAADGDGLRALRVSLQLARIPALVALLVVGTSLWARWAEALQVLDLAALRWSWVALAAAGLGFLTVALAGRAHRHPPWLLAGEGLVAAAVALLLLVPGGLGAYVFGGGQPGGMLESLAQLVEALGLTQGRSWFAPVLALAWVVIVADAAGRQLLKTDA